MFRAPGPENLQRHIQAPAQVAEAFIGQASGQAPKVAVRLHRQCQSLAIPSLGLVLQVPGPIRVDEKDAGSVTNFGSRAPGQRL